MTYQDLVSDKQVIVILGAGGVGKTSTSVATAIMAAYQGRRVGLLSIDPAKRLADALGIKLGSELASIELGPDCPGSLAAAMLDQKAVFDQMIERSAPSEKTAGKIKDHPFYKAAAANLGGAVEYMALAKLGQMYDSGEYDCIVVDTPPDTHALDFLSRPNILSGFVENKVINWLLKPFLLAQRMGLGKAFSVGEKLMGGIASVTGIGALKMMAEFMVLMQEVIEGFHASGQRVAEIVKSAGTSFVLVSSPRSAPARSAENMLRQLRERELPCDFLLLNRCLDIPNWTKLRHLDPQQLTSDPTLGRALKAAFAAQIEADQIKERLKTVGKDVFGKNIPSHELQELDGDFHSIVGIMTFVRELQPE